MDVKPIPALAAGSSSFVTPAETRESTYTARSSRNHPQCLTAAEADQTHPRFADTTFRPRNQVMWSGILREWAQVWADKRDMQTLNTVMGPLMDKEHSSCLKSTKSAKEWSIYIKGRLNFMHFTSQRPTSSLFLQDSLPKY